MTQAFFTADYREQHRCDLLRAHVLKTAADLENGGDEDNSNSINKSKTSVLSPISPHQTQSANITTTTTTTGKNQNHQQNYQSQTPTTTTTYNNRFAVSDR
eukprot:UN09469